MINRSAAIVRPSKPYIDWASNLDDSGIIPDPEGEPSVYLLPEYDTDDEGWALLSEGFDVIFDSELEGWHTDDTTWPKNRTFTMFQRWFQVTLCSCIDDLCEGPIIDDNDEF